MIVREFGAGDYCDWCGKEGQYAYLYAEVCLCSKCAATERGSAVNAKNELLIAAHYGVLDGVDPSTLTQGIRGMVEENTQLTTERDALRADVEQLQRELAAERSRPWWKRRK